MEPNVVFNVTVCVLGIAIFLIHSVDLAFKKNKRRDEWNLLAFFLFTAFHFSVYLALTLIQPRYKSDGIIMASYTSFYIMNNLELIFLFAYAISYIGPKKKIAKATMIINFAISALYIGLDIANIFGRFFFAAEGGKYVRGDFMLLSQGYQFVAFATVFILAVTDRKLSPSEKAAFVLYCLLPAGAIIVQNRFAGYAIAYLSIVVSIEILFLFANVKKNALLADEERKNKEAEIRIMMSQIQPHFVYNALSSISTLIQTDPDKAQKGLDQFTEYLRTNLSLLSDTHLIPFSDELRHIKAYLSLEQMRFDERLNVVYDIQDDSFLVPPLSVQPIVENAVKHGILQKIEGGTVTVRSYPSGTDHVVEILDDGVGFDASSKPGSEHIGLGNVYYRLHSMCDGEIDVQSQIGVGTKITLTYHEGGRK